MTRPHQQSVLRRWGVGACLTVLIVIGLLGLSGGLLLWVVPLVLIGVAVAVWRARRQRAQRLIDYLHHATRTGQPMLALLDAAALDESIGMNHRLRGVMADLRNGEPLHLALGRNVPELTRRELDLVAVGERTGRLEAMLARLTHRRSHLDRQAIGDPGLTMGMAMLVLTWCAMIFGFAGFGIAHRVLPKFQRIFADIGVAPPTDLPHPGSPGWLAASVALGLVGWAGVIVMLAVFTGSRVATARWWSPWRSVVDGLAWHLPALAGAMRSRALGDLCGTAGEAVDAGLPLPQAAREAGRSCGNRVLARRAVAWAQQMEAGAAPADAARAARLPRLISGMLAPSGAAPDAARTLRFCADHYAASYSRATELLRAAVIPLLVSAQALMVGLLAVWVVRSVVALLEGVMASADGLGAGL